MFYKWIYLFILIFFWGACNKASHNAVPVQTEVSTVDHDVTENDIANIEVLHPSEMTQAYIPIIKIYSASSIPEEGLTNRNLQYFLKNLPAVSPQDDAQSLSQRPINADHQLLPNWLLLGEDSFQSMLTQLENLTPRIYIGQVPYIEEYTEEVIRNYTPDIMMSRENFFPVLSPEEFSFYTDDFVNINHNTELQSTSLTKEYKKIYWERSYLDKKTPIIYEYETHFWGFDGRLQLLFKDEKLNNLFFLPEDHMRITLDDTHPLPFSADLIFGESTLHDVIQHNGLHGALKFSVESTYNYVDKTTTLTIVAIYQQEVLWHDLPLTIHYKLNIADEKDNLDPFQRLVITGISIFNFDDWSTEWAFLEEKIPELYPQTEEDVAWLHQRFKEDILVIEHLTSAYDHITVPPDFYLVNDQYVIFHSGCCAMTRHTSVVMKDDFHYPSFMFQ
ncbi:hypothetical protein PVA45_01680 [Entomospira entomophila]|uniref:Uncharacterized protein n=1 Tax=Entomospira entomophila TaxID=2719988 RepID=A0A968GAS5_9SPIO|nr:hypothetical protein [Entomospira entomophilus]NIZ40223.1 hypothetical protein [Entomospira entomophilus]WDI35782.1 hypothetical protein PVA45_01680 [Entomospira entomophilus]